MQQFYDISPALTPQTRVYPGDQPLSYTSVSDMAQGDQLNLSEFSATTHLGAHIDAPSHYIQGGKSIGDIDLNRLMGRCQVMRLDIKGNKAIYPDHLPPIGKGISRILLCANPNQDFNVWSNDCAYLSLELAQFFVKQKIELVGIDSPSVDACEASDAPAHRTLLSQDILIMENLDLNEVPEGIYELIALPLKLMQAEAAPMRAILKKL